MQQPCVWLGEPKDARTVRGTSGAHQPIMREDALCLGSMRRCYNVDLVVAVILSVFDGGSKS